MPEAFSRLANTHALLPYAAICIAYFALVYAVRRWLPSVWLRLERIVPEGVGVPVSNILLALPGVAFGATVAALSSGGSLPVAFYGAVSASLAPVLHHALKALPVPYQGAVRTVGKQLDAKARAKLGGASLFLLVLLGCARPAGRDACYARADAEAFQSYLTACADYPSTRECPAANEIEERHRVAQEVCP